MNKPNINTVASILDVDSIRDFGDVISFNFHDGLSISSTCVNRYIHVSRDIANAFYLEAKAGWKPARTGNDNGALSRFNSFINRAKRNGWPILKANYEHFD